MSNYIKKAAAHARLLKLASAARLIRRQRALQKYAQAVQMQKRALSTGAQVGIGTGLGGLIGAGVGYGLGKKDKKLLSTLLGAGSGAAIGGLGTYGLSGWLNGKKGITAPGIIVPGSHEHDPYYGAGHKEEMINPISVSDIKVTPNTKMPTTPTTVVSVAGTPVGTYGATPAGSLLQVPTIGGVTLQPGTQMGSLGGTPVVAAPAGPALEIDDPDMTTLSVP